ncbi:MAG TPA: PhzF family phenazine biosynthesis protein [Paucimonas sp.]|nr:PhzF family phenazine biosynthesis protein [Paucimonas sp.]
MPTSVSVAIVNAFVDGNTGGNPAGVVIAADALNSEQKLAVARAVGLSETAFVSRSEQAAFKLEFFTPTRQIPHCGHATIATFSLLRERGLVGNGTTSKETIDGIRKIEIDGELVFMEQRAPKYTGLTPAQIASVMDSIGASRAALAPGAEPCIVDTGNPFVLVPLARESDLAGLRPDFAAISALSEELHLIGYHVFARKPAGQERLATARMFAPLYGIDEEAATGMAAGPLACHLFDRGGERRTTMLIEQGVFMAPPSPSLLTARLELEAGNIARLFVGGRAKVTAEKRIEV